MHSNEHVWQLLTEIRQEMKEVRQDVNRYKGFIGGVLLIVSVVMSFAGFLISYLKG